jgi:uncharacterized protein (TIGR03083 family)
MAATPPVWPEVRAQRLALAQRLRSLTPDEADRPTGCGAWRVREVLAHLVHLAEATTASMARDALRHPGAPDAMLDRVARKLAECPVEELAGRLAAAADGRFRVPGFPPSAALGDVLVHGCDLLGPFDERPSVEPEMTRGVLDLYWWFGSMAFHAKGYRRVRLQATDLQWACGRGPEVRGSGLDLLGAVARRPAALDRLEGEGVAVLRA